MDVGEVGNSAGDNDIERPGYRKRIRSSDDSVRDSGGSLPVNGSGNSNSGSSNSGRGPDAAKGNGDRQQSAGGERSYGGDRYDRQYSSGENRSSGGDRYDRPGSSGGDRYDRPRAQAMEVIVENNVEKAMKVLKRKLIKEGLFKELKSRRYYEKPSEKKKRKHKESVKKIRKEEARQKRNPFLFS